MVHSVGYNDAVLFLSLLYSCVDLQYEWDMFETCARPVHRWLIVSYVSVIGFRLAYILGSWSTEGASTGAPSNAFLLALRHKNAFPRVLSHFIWLVAVPFFLVWTVMGTIWLWSVRSESPQCMPTDTHFWFAAFWLALSYVWISIYVALGAVAATLEWRVRRAEGDLRQIEDADVISRWGHVSRLSGYQELPTGQGQGLAPAEICQLLGEATLAMGEEAEGCNALECSICITPFEVGDKVRCLPTCNHTFHKACIDLWLLRSRDCPLCKRSVRGIGN